MLTVIVAVRPGDHDGAATRRGQSQGTKRWRPYRRADARPAYHPPTPAETPQERHELTLARARAEGRVPLNRHALLSRLLDHPSVIHSVLSSADALKVIRLLDESRAWDGIAGQVIPVARQRCWPVLTTDPDRLRIAPDLDVDLL